MVGLIVGYATQATTAATWGLIRTGSEDPSHLEAEFACRALRSRCLACATPPPISPWDSWNFFEGHSPGKEFVIQLLMFVPI